MGDVTPTLSVECEGCDPAVDLGEQAPGFDATESTEVSLKRIAGDVLRQLHDRRQHVGATHSESNTVLEGAS